MNTPRTPSSLTNRIEGDLMETTTAHRYGHLGYSDDINPIIPQVRQKIIDLTGRDIGDRRTRKLIESVRADVAAELLRPFRVAE